MITEEEVKKLRSDYLKKQYSQDVDGCLSYCDEDCIWLPPNMPMVKGHEEGRAFYEAFFKAVKPDTKVFFDEIGVSEKWSFAIGTHESVDTPVDGGESIHSKGKYLEIHKRQPDGSLKFYRHMWSEDE